MLELSASSNARPTAPAHTMPGEQPSLVLDSRHLFAQRTRVLIRHGLDTYVLRLTCQGKLTLTK